MRILFLNHNTVRGGGTYYRAFDIATHLVRHGHRVTLVATSNNRRWGFDTEERDGVSLVHSPDLFWGVGRSGWDPWNTLNRLGYLRGKDWDIIHAWDSRPSVILPALYARRLQKGRAPLVLDWCDWWGRGGTQAERTKRWMRLIAPIETFFEEHFRTQADGTTVISKALRQRAVSLGVPPARIRILEQGCRAHLTVANDVSRVVARRRLGVPDDASLAMSVGALPRSDASLLFETVREVLSRRPQCRFALVGRHGAAIPDDLRHNPRFVETGFVADEVLLDYMHACDLLVTALADTIAGSARWPSKVNPFLAIGRAVAMTRVGDLAALLEQERAALVTPATPSDLANGVCSAVDDAGLRRRLEQQGLRVAAHRLSWDRLVGELEQFYAILRGAGFETGIHELVECTSSCAGRA